MSARGSVADGWLYRTRGARRSPARRVLLLATGIGTLPVTLVVAQQPEARVVAHAGLPTAAVTEPAVAAGDDTAVTVFFDSRSSSTHKAHYAAYNTHTDRWATGPIESEDPNTVFSGVMDLSVAYDPTSRAFLAAAKTVTKILTCRFDPGPKLGEVTPRGWRVIREQAFALDKPWIVAGEALPGGREYYIVYWIGWGQPYGYLRSVDGGQSWFHDEVRLADTGEPVEGTFCAQPAVWQDRPLYVAYVTSQHSIRFLKGVDSATAPPQVEFYELLAPPPEGDDPVRVPVSVPLNDQRIWLYLPGDQQSPTAATVPQLAVDPTNADRLYIVYHDIAEAGSADVNVYIRELTRAGDYWQLGLRIPVNDDETLYESDQFLPSVTVDDVGRIHAIFYDDRNYTDGPQGDLQPDDSVDPKFDAYYAWAPPGDLSFVGRNAKLFLKPESDPPALDWTVQHVNFREYIGIAWCRYPAGVKVWTAYTGTWEEDPQPDDAVIWSSRIPFSQ